MLYFQRSWIGIFSLHNEHHELRREVSRRGFSRANLSKAANEVQGHRKVLIYDR